MKCLDLVTSRAEKNGFREFGKIIGGYKYSPKNVLTNALSEQIFFLTQYWAIYLFNIFIVSQQQINYFCLK